MLQEAVGRGVGHRPAGRTPASAQAHEAHLQQHVQGAARQGHAAHAFDLGAGDGLVVGDDGEGLQRRTRQATRLLALLGHQEAEVFGGAETPAAGDLIQLDPPPGVAFTQPRESAFHIGAVRQARRDLGRAERGGGGEQQGLDLTLGLAGGRQGVSSSG